MLVSDEVAKNMILKELYQQEENGLTINDLMIRLPIRNGIGWLLHELRNEGLVRRSAGIWYWSPPGRYKPKPHFMALGL